jgi:hypothetical protein
LCICFVGRAFLLGGVVVVSLLLPGRARAGPTDFRFSFDLESGPMFSRQTTSPRMDMAGFSSFTARSHMRVGHNATISGGLGLSPISVITLMTFIVGEPVILPDPIINLQVPVTFTYFFRGVGQYGPYAFGGPRFMIVPVLPCVNGAQRCPDGRGDAFGYGPAGEAGVGYQFNQGAAWRASLSYLQARLFPLGRTGDTQAFDGIYHGVILSFGGITDAL